MIDFQPYLTKEQGSSEQYLRSRYKLLRKELEVYNDAPFPAAGDHLTLIDTFGDPHVPRHRFHPAREIKADNEFNLADIPPEFRVEQRQRAMPFVQFSLPQYENFEIVRVVKDGERSMSQAYTVRFSHANNTPNETHPTFVLKLYQESLFDEERDLYKLQREVLPYLKTANEVSQVDSWAYNQMRHLQGSVIPYSYGFYMVKMPSGINLIGHLMEEVVGEDLWVHLSAVEKARDKKQFFQIADAMAWSLYSMHLSSVLRYILQASSMKIIRNPSSNSPTIVLFGFAHSKPDSTHELDKYKTAASCDSGLVESVLMEAGIRGAIFGEWFRSRFEAKVPWMYKSHARIMDMTEEGEWSPGDIDRWIGSDTPSSGWK